MLPKKGKKLPVWEGALAGRQAYAEIIASLLRQEHGDSHRAVKQLMRQTGASERTIKHWLAANHGPDNVYLLRLIATSPVIRAFVQGVIEMGVRGQQVADRELLDRRAASTNSAPGLVGSVHITADDPINDPDRDRISDPMTEPLKRRQQWFLERVVRGIRSTASDIELHWGVSPKTARRDIAALRSAGLIHFTGARRNGRYRAS